MILPITLSSVALALSRIIINRNICRLSDTREDIMITRRLTRWHAGEVVAVSLTVRL